MALEEELLETEEEEVVETAEAQKNEDDLTDEEIDALKELKESLGREVLVKCLKKRVDNEKEAITKRITTGFITPEPEGFTIYNVLGGFIAGIELPEKILEHCIRDPEEVKKAVEDLQKMEDEQLGN